MGLRPRATARERRATAARDEGRQTSWATRATRARRELEDRGMIGPRQPPRQYVRPEEGTKQRASYERVYEAEDGSLVDANFIYLTPRTNGGYSRAIARYVEIARRNNFDLEALLRELDN